MNIYITPQNEEWLRSIPNEMTMSGLVNKLLAEHFASDPYGNLGGNDSEKVKAASTPVSEQPQESPKPIEDVYAVYKTKPGVLADIKELEAQLAEELEYCQDPKEAKRIKAEYQPRIDGLWVEYRELS